MFVQKHWFCSGIIILFFLKILRDQSTFSPSKNPKMRQLFYFQLSFFELSKTPESAKITSPNRMCKVQTKVYIDP